MDIWTPAPYDPVRENHMLLWTIAVVGFVVALALISYLLYLTPDSEDRLD